MADATLQLGAIDSPHRENFSPLRTVFFVLIHLGALAVFWQTTWGAIAVCIGLHILCGGFGICVGYHRCSLIVIQDGQGRRILYGDLRCTLHAGRPG